MKNCYNLDLNFSPLREDFVFPVTSDSKRTIHLYGRNMLSDECREWLGVAGLVFHKVFIFEDPGTDNKRIIHIDGNNASAKKFAINWNYGCNDFVMEWFNVTERDEFDNFKYPYVTFNEETSTLIESSTGKGPVLFNTSAPHSVMNREQTRRYGVTMRFINNFSWDEAVVHLSKFIKQD